MFDTIIIGAGITGTAVAHFISKTALSVLVVEAKEDLPRQTAPLCMRAMMQSRVR